MAGTIPNISERKKKEENNSLLYYALQKSLNEIYIFSSKTFLFQYVNDGALKNTAYSLEEIKKLSLLDISPAFTNKTFNDLLTPLENGTKEKIITFTDIKRKDGSLYPVEVHMQFFRQEQENVFIAIVLDISERKNIENKLAREIQNQQKLTSEIALHAQEKERNELGKELHNNISQILATVKMFLGLAKSGQGTNDELIGMCHVYLSEAMEEIRKISHHLMTPSLDDMDLKDALDDLIHNTNILNNLNIELVIDENFQGKRLDKNKKLVLYRIIQEQLNNIMKYSLATGVVVTFRMNKSNYFLTIADNNDGIKQSQKNRGIGIKKIKTEFSFTPV